MTKKFSFRDHTRKMIDKLKADLADLETEWDRLDSQGTGTEEQRKIAAEMLKISVEIDGFEQLLQRLGERK